MDRQGRQGPQDRQGRQGLPRFRALPEAHAAALLPVGGMRRSAKRSNVALVCRSTDSGAGQTRKYVRALGQEELKPRPLGALLFVDGIGSHQLAKVEAFGATRGLQRALRYRHMFPTGNFKWTALVVFPRMRDAARDLVL